jgi:Mrp family chromosome partitioning ATPase
MIRLEADAAALARDGLMSDELREHSAQLLRCLPWSSETPRRESRALGVTACGGGAGVSTLAASLAETAASAEEGPVLLVDANLERPRAHRLLGVDPAPGLAEALADGTPAPYLQVSSVANLAVLAAGAAGARLARIWAAPALAEVFKTLRAEFSLIVVDMPPPDRASFVGRLASLLDGVLLVVEADCIRADVARRQKDLLARAKARLLGVVLTKQKQHIPTSLNRYL